VADAIAPIGSGPPTDLRSFCERRLVGMKNVRDQIEQDMREVSDLCQPMRSRWLQSDNNKAKVRANSKLRDNHGVMAARILASGMSSGLASLANPWFKLETADKDMMEYGPVKEWLAEVERRLYAFFASTNFYTAAKSGFAENGIFGTEAGVMVEHPVAGMVTHSLTMGEYWIAADETGEITTLVRRVPMTCEQAINSFGFKCSQHVRDCYSRGDYSTEVNVFHAMIPNGQRKIGRADSRNMAYASVWWDAEDTAQQGTLLRQSGFNEKPFWCARWDAVGGDVWGYSPALEALPELRELMIAKKRKGEVTDYIVKPPMKASQTAAGKKINTQPGAWNAFSSADLPNVGPLFQLPPQALQAVREDYDEVKRAIDRTFYVDLFMAITRMEGVQPRNVEEIARRYEEQLNQLGTMVTRANTEKLSPAVERAYAILERANALPPPPDEMNGAPVQIEFVSLLTQMQRVVGASAIERTVNFALGLGQAVPDVVDKIDLDQAVDEYARIVGAPPSIVRSDEDVEAMREAKAQARQMQEMAAMAPAAKQGADAMKSMAETAAMQREQAA
jgi:hypothetical protein